MTVQQKPRSRTKGRARLSSAPWVGRRGALRRRPYGAMVPISQSGRRLSTNRSIVAQVAQPAVSPTASRQRGQSWALANGGCSRVGNPRNGNSAVCFDNTALGHGPNFGCHAANDDHESGRCQFVQFLTPSVLVPARLAKEWKMTSKRVSKRRVIRTQSSLRDSASAVGRVTRARRLRSRAGARAAPLRAWAGLSPRSKPRRQPLNPRLFPNRNKKCAPRMTSVLVSIT